MEGDVIILANVKFRYAVGLTTDDGGNVNKPTFSRSLTMLKDFLASRGEKYEGPFVQNGEKHEEYAVVSMSPQSEAELQDINAELRQTQGERTFVARLEGELFDICKADDMTIHPVHVPYYPEFTN